MRFDDRTHQFAADERSTTHQPLLSHGAGYE